MKCPKCGSSDIYAATFAKAGGGKRYKWQCGDCAWRGPITEGSRAFSKCRAALTMADALLDDMRCDCYTGEPLCPPCAAGAAAKAARTSMRKAEGKET